MRTSSAAATSAVEEAIGRGVDVGGWLVNVNTSSFPRGEAFGAVVGREFVLFDVRDGSVSRLKKWDLDQLDAKPTAGGVALALPWLSGSAEFGAVDESGRELLQTLVRDAGPRRRLWLSLLSPPVLGAGFLYRSVVDGARLEDELPAAVAVAAATSVLVATAIALRLVRRRRFLRAA